MISREELKEDLIVATIMGGVSIIVTLVGLIVRRYVEEKVQ